MFDDICHAKVSLADKDARENWNGMIQAFLAHGTQTPEHLGKLLEAAPDLAIAHAVKGIFCVLLGRREMTETARGAAATARALVAQGDSDSRTMTFLTCLEAWLEGSPDRAILALDTELLANPQDTLAAKIAHGMRFIIGDAPGMLRSIERVVPAHGPDHPLYGYMLGCQAFALEETGSYAQAERAGLDGLTYTTDDAWGLHAVTHVHDMTGRPDDGIALIKAHDQSWLGSNNFRYHVWWHKALLHLDRGEYATVLDLYDHKIRCDQTDDYRDIANATSLLIRLELEGIKVGDRWDELAALSDARSEDGCLVFADLHYMLGLIGGDRAQAVNRLTARIRRDAGGPTQFCNIVADPGVAAAEGLAAFGEGRYDLAFSQLSGARDHMQRIGGSHAQRDVFERITIDAGLRAGRLDATEAILTDRRRLRGGAVDSFAETRFQRIAAARAVSLDIPAQ